MKLGLKILISLPIAGLMLFSAFGFLAAFELRSPNVWHAVYLLALLLLAVLTILIWRRPRNR